MEYNITVEAENADFDNEVYYRVYAASAVTLTVNSFSISMDAETTLDILVKSISDTPGVYLIGTNRYAVDASKTLSKYPEPEEIAPTPPGPDIDVDVQAFLDATGISDSSIITALETFVNTLKTESLWDKMVAIYPFVTDKTNPIDIQAQFKYNLKDPQDTDSAYRLVTFGSVTYSPEGITNFNNGNYIRTYIYSDNPTAFPTGPNFINLGYYLRTNTDTDYGILGNNDTGLIQSPYYISVRDFGSGPFGYLFNYGASSNYNIATANCNDLGTHVFNRIDNSIVEVATPSGTSSRFLPLQVPSTTVGLGIGYRGLTTTNIISHYYFSDQLSSIQITTMQTSVNQLQTDLGRATH